MGHDPDPLGRDAEQFDNLVAHKARRDVDKGALRRRFFH
jgi:hypothetical protein